MKLCFTKTHHQSVTGQVGSRESNDICIICILDTTSCSFQRTEAEGNTEGLTVMTNHGPAIQSGPLQREPLMQVNHILNILISKSGGKRVREEG